MDVEVFKNKGGVGLERDAEDSTKRGRETERCEMISKEG